MLDLQVGCFRRWSVKLGASIKLVILLLVMSLHTEIASAQVVAPQGPVVATTAAGSDIGDRVNHALRSCALQCTVYIPAGNYSFATTIRLELNPFGKYGLRGDPGAV